MSIEEARGFWTKVNSDQELAGKVKSCTDAAGRFALAQAAGFNFTLDELKAAASELSDSELDSVGGGALGPAGKEIVMGFIMSPF